MRFSPARIHKRVVDLPFWMPSLVAANFEAGFRPNPLRRSNRRLAQLVEPPEPSSERPIAGLDASSFGRNGPPKFAEFKAQRSGLPAPRPKVATLGLGPAGAGRRRLAREQKFARAEAAGLEAAGLELGGPDGRQGGGIEAGGGEAARRRVNRFACGLLPSRR